MNEKDLEAVMGLVMYGGEGKSNAIEAIEAAKAGNFELADAKLKAADEAIVQAHHAQTAMLTEEASGNHREVTLLMVHGQDHLMTSMAFKDLAKEIVHLYKVLATK